MKTILVLAMHGMTPKDFPADEKKEFMRLHALSGSGEWKDSQRLRHDELDHKMRRWPRTPQNDPYHEAALQLASDLESCTGLEVILGYNEFCAPTLQEAFASAASKKPERVVVVTPMMTRGGNHSEEEIPEEVRTARERFPEVRFEYAWPFDSKSVARFLAGHVQDSIPAR